MGKTGTYASWFGRTDKHNRRSTHVSTSGKQGWCCPVIPDRQNVYRLAPVNDCIVNGFRNDSVLTHVTVRASIHPSIHLASQASIHPSENQRLSTTYIKAQHYSWNTIWIRTISLLPSYSPLVYKAISLLNIYWLQSIPSPPFNYPRNIKWTA